MKFVLSLIITVAAFGFCHSQIPKFGKCPDFEPLKPFDLQKYTGKWYEYERSFFIFGIGAKCVEATYSLNNDSSIQVINDAVNLNKNMKMEGRAVQVNKNDRPAKLAVKFPGIPAVGDYEVVATDYDTYAVVLSCSEYLCGGLHTEVLWLLTRDREAAGVDLNKVYKEIDSAKINRRGLRRTNQKDCSN